MEPVSIILTTIGWLASPIFKKIADEAWQQFTQRVGIKAEMDDLTAQLESFQVPVETTETTKYLKDVKELISKAKDLLDELDYFRLQDEVMEKNKAEQGNFFSKLKLPSPSDVPSSSTKKPFKELKFKKKEMCKRMKDLVEKLKQKFEPLNSTIQQQLLSSIVEKLQNVKTPLSERPETTSYSLEEKIYGRDNEIEQIKNLINHGEQDSHKLRVISLVGHGGVGKTTLAQQVFNQPTVKFDKKIWISVSTNLDEKGITCQMLQCCSPNNLSHDNISNEDLLKRKLEEYLKEKTFLVVLDDIWEMSKTHWELLVAPLKKVVANNTTGNIGSTVIVTTRDPTIATMVSTTNPIHLDKLDDNSLWLFFIKCAFGDDRHNVPIVLENIGRKIVERLIGNPLAAKTVGNMLNGKSDRAWAEVLENEQWKDLGEKEGIMPILRLSYDKLHINLKQCFSYCSLFPKDYYFKAKDLVYMWMAQDFINKNDGIVKNFHPKKDESTEDVGFEYLNLLVERAFLQKVITDGDVRYVMHDLMHDLAQVVSSGEILMVTHPEHCMYPSSLRHLSFIQDVKYTIEDDDQFENLSSLVIFKNVYGLKDTLNWHQANIFHLRLLIFPFMSSISYNFTHLRYLNLYLHKFDEENTFPVQICRLYHLEVLELEPKFMFKELPKEFNNLINLRHFIATKDLHSMVVDVGRLKYLRKLKKFVVREERGFNLGQLSELNNLRGSLELCSLQNVKRREEAVCVRLSKKEIDKLTLHWDTETEDKPPQNRGDRGKWRTWINGEGRECKTTNVTSEEILEALKPSSELRHLRIRNYRGCKSPSWLTNHSIKCLESIRLSNCKAWEELPNFGQLVYLKELYLRGLTKVKAFGPQFHGCGPLEGFPSLKVMNVTYMDGLETWDWGERCNVFPSLNDLYVSNCPQLVKFPLLDPVKVHKENTEWFPMLDQLEISDCPQLQQGRNTEYGWLKGKLKIANAKDPKIFFFIFRFSKNIHYMEINYCSNLTSLLWKCICMIHSLKELRFEGCHELCFSQPVEENDDGSTFYSHESLQELEIWKCSVTGEELSYLLAHVPALCKLSIRWCNGIGPVSLSSSKIEPNRSFLEADVEVDKDRQQSPDSLMCLEKLFIEACPNLVFVNEGGLSGLSALKIVSIYDSDKLLSSMIQEQGSNYVQTLHVKESNVTSLNLYNFVALRELMLRNCKDLAWVEGPNSPARLEVYIADCPQLAKTQSQIEPKFLMAMEKLIIDNIEFLSMHANSLSMSLHSLTIDGFYSQLELWSEWTEEQENAVIKHLTALEELTLSYCTKLRFLPSTLHLHPSLRELTIKVCPEIKSLPQGGFPKTLQKLRLVDYCKELKSQCSQLEDFECSKETGRSGLTYVVFSKRDPSAN